MRCFLFFYRRSWTARLALYEQALTVCVCRRLLSIQYAQGHANNRDSRVVWLGNTDHVLSTGLGPNREREVTLRDVRNLTNPLKNVAGDSSLGIYLPLYDIGTCAWTSAVASRDLKSSDRSETLQGTAILILAVIHSSL